MLWWKFVLAKVSTFFILIQGFYSFSSSTNIEKTRSFPVKTRQHLHNKGLFHRNVRNDTKKAYYIGYSSNRVTEIVPPIQSSMFSTPYNIRVKRREAQPAVAPMKSAYIDGHIMIGGLFPVHKKHPNPLVSCGDIQGDRGIQRLEAMLYALDRVNDDKKLLPHITLGANIMDTCSRDTYALEQALEYVRASMTSLETPKYICDDGSDAREVGSSTSSKAVLGVIGGSYSTVSIQVGHIPLV